MVLCSTDLSKATLVQFDNTGAVEYRTIMFVETRALKNWTRDSGWFNNTASKFDHICMIKFYQTAEGLHGLHDKATIKEAERKV